MTNNTSENNVELQMNQQTEAQVPIAAERSGGKMDLQMTGAVEQVPPSIAWLSSLPKEVLQGGVGVSAILSVAVLVYVATGFVKACRG